MPSASISYVNKLLRDTFFEASNNLMPTILPSDVTSIFVRADAVDAVFYLQSADLFFLKRRRLDPVATALINDPVHLSR